MEKNMTEIEEVGPTYLYKDGKAVVYEGEAVAKAMNEGWIDHPVATVNPAPKPPTKPAPATASAPAPAPKQEPEPKSKEG